MELQRLLKSELLDLCEELGVEAGTSMKKMELVKAIQEEGLDNDEIEVMWKRIKNRNEDDAKFKELELEKLRLEVELRKTNGGPEMEVAGSRNLYDMSKLIQPFKVEQDMGLYLVNFERACERARFNRDSWPRRLLGVLPCEAAGVIARLTAEEADDYECVKGCLLKKYRLSAEAFRQKFRSVSKKPEASYAEFAYELRSYLIEWMKVAKSYDDKERILEVVALEQFYKTLSEPMRTWIQDKTDVDSVYKAADFADEYSSRRNNKEGTGKTFEKTNWDERRGKGWKGREPTGRNTEENRGDEETKASQGSDADDRQKKKAFEARRPITCFNCHETGHIAARCTKPRVVFACASHCAENDELLSPYLFDMTVNGKACRVLRDSGATIDLVHPTYVTEANYNGKCSWIKSVLDKGSVCLPVADVLVSGPFGEVRTEAAVSDKLPPQYRYLFSNRTEKILREQGKSLGEGLVQAVIRAKAHEVSTRLAYDDSSPGNLKDSPVRVLEQSSPKETRKGLESEKSSALDRETPDEQLTQTDGVLLAPTSKGFEQLVSETKVVLIEEQRADPSLTKLWETCKDGVARKNVTFPVHEDVLYFAKLIFVIAGLVIAERVASLTGFVCCGLCFFGVLAILDDLKADLFRRAAETPPLQRSSRPWRSCNERRLGDRQASKRPSKKPADVGKRPGNSTFQEPIGLPKAQGQAAAARRECWTASFQEARRRGKKTSHSAFQESHSGPRGQCILSRPSQVDPTRRAPRTQLPSLRKRKPLQQQSWMRAAPTPPTPRGTSGHVFGTANLHGVDGVCGRTRGCVAVCGGGADIAS